MKATMTNRRTLSSRENEADVDMTFLKAMCHQLNYAIWPTDPIPTFDGDSKSLLKMSLRDRVSLISIKYADNRDTADRLASELADLRSRMTAVDATMKSLNMTVRACRMARGHSVSSAVNACSREARAKLTEELPKGMYSGLAVKDGRVTVDLSVDEFIEMACDIVECFASRALHKAEDIVGINC
jgi:hypothetical protein